MYKNLKRIFASGAIILFITGIVIAGLENPNILLSYVFNIVGWVFFITTHYFKKLEKSKNI